MPRKVIREFATPALHVIITVTGEEQLKRAFSAFTPKLQKKIERRVTRTIAYHIRSKVQQITPVYTGKMQATYMVRVASLRLSADAMSKAGSSRRRTRKGVVGHAVKTGTRAKLNIPAKDKYYYPAIVEFGAPKRNIKPNPVMRRTLSNQKSMARMLYRTLMAAEVRKTVKELRAGTIRPDGVKIKR
jgi:hypothetical protein